MIFMRKQSSKKHYDKHVLGTLGTMALLGMLGTMPVTAGVSPATQPTSLQQQKDVVKGHIVDENGEPLIGVTVRAAHGAATVTDVDGN